jgi:hypothetical protein
MIENILSDKKNKFLIKKKNEDDEYQKYLLHNIHLSDNDDLDLNEDNLDEYNEKTFILRSSDNTQHANNTIVVPVNVVSPREINRAEYVTNVDRNEYKINKLQEKIETKLRQEYEGVLKMREKEVETKTREELQATIDDLKSQLEVDLEEERKRLEIAMELKWEEKYESIVIECKSKLREEKEKKLAQNMYHKLKPSVEKEIYKNEYSNIEKKIKAELEEKLTREITDKKLEEIEKAKRKYEYMTKTKSEEIEKNLNNKFKEEFDTELKKELEKREKNIKTK